MCTLRGRLCQAGNEPRRVPTLLGSRGRGNWNPSDRRGDSRLSGGHNQPETAFGESGDGRQVGGAGPMLAEKIGATRQFESPPQ